MYNVDIDDLTAVNHISDVTSVEVGQLIFIPGGKSVIVRQQFEVTANEDFMWPLKGRLIASFGVMAGGMRNNGINIVPGSDKNVLASRSGRIVFYDADFYGWGKIVIIDHGDGYASVYGRNADVFVKVGDTVSKGMPIARVGTAGRDTHEYLHFEIRKGSVAQNPKFYLP
jgi:lipoprotein NlpD